MKSLSLHTAPATSNTMPRVTLPALVGCLVLCVFLINNFSRTKKVPRHYETNEPRVCVLVATTSRTRSNALATYTIPSLKRTTEPRFAYSLWVGLDKGDAVDASIGRLAAPIPVRFVEVDNPSRKPGPVFNRLSSAAVRDGCDYLYRINDDTELIGPWTSAFVRALEGFDPPNVGVVGPTCHEGNVAILTHDFVHRTHHAIFGYHYPPTLTDWWLDDWISKVYGPNRTQKLRGVVVRHHLMPTSYKVTWDNERLLTSEIEAGQRTLRAFLGQDTMVLKRGRLVPLQQLPSPLYVVFVNRAFRDLLNNMLCHARHMTGFLEHLLVITSDEDLVLDDLAVWHVHNNLSRFVDFQTRPDLDMMQFRGHVLLELLHMRTHVVVWLEPDMVFFQDPTTRPELVPDNATDLILMDDQPGPCGCFIVFNNATSGAYEAYREVMARLDDALKSSETWPTNDQILLDQVAPRTRHRVLDSCLYRNGQQFEGRCVGNPVMIHNNWVVGGPAKIERFKKHGMWLVDGACADHGLLLVVMTMDREASLRRLLASCVDAEYPPYTRIDLQVNVDRLASGAVHEGVVRLLSEFQWPHGLFRTNVWPVKKGITDNWLDGWDPLTQAGYTAAVFLEDDLQVSRFFAKWFLGAHAAHKRDKRIAAVSGQRQYLVAALDVPGPLETYVEKGTRAFAYRLIGTWSFSPKAEVWVEFREWMRGLDADFMPTVPGLVPDQWFREFIPSGRHKEMYEMWFIRFCHERNYFTLYAWPDDGASSMVCNWREKGLHFDGSAAGCDIPLVQKWDPALLTSKPKFYDWNMKVVERVAFATLVTNSAGKTSASHSFTYLDQSLMLSKQLQSLYPDIERLAVVAEGQVSQGDASKLQAAGYRVIWRPPIFPMGEQAGLDAVYRDQSMKFWLWDETNYTRIVYIDSDTFFLGYVDFDEEINRREFVACPTQWSAATASGRPLTLNGGFFILTPSNDQFKRLMSGTQPTHFSSHYADLAWLDKTEMGILMREFPDFAWPRNITAFCGEQRFCCKSQTAHCAPKPFIPTPATKSVMVHGLKPSGVLKPGEPLSKLLQGQPPASRGYDHQCVMKEFIEPLSDLMAQDELYSNDIKGTPSKFFDFIRKKVDCKSLWENATIDATRQSEPLASIPDAMLDAFTYNGRVALRPYATLFNQVYLGGLAMENVWTKKHIEDWKKQCGNKTLQGNYGVAETNWLREGLRQVPMTNVLVIGSENPWVEACVLDAGAKHITTLEYGNITSQHPRVKTITPSVMRTQYDRYANYFDTVVTFSSVEHAGLGRYGDAMNPYGDRQAIARAWCATKEGGHLVIAVPVGADAIEYNAHRIYGPVMYPHLVANWRQVWRAPSGDQVVHVLRKSSGRWLCLSDKPYGRTGNQLLTLGYALWYARNLSGVQLLCPGCEWVGQIETPSNLVLGDNEECAETVSWENMFYKQFGVRGVFPPPVPSASVRRKAEQAWPKGKRTSVHGRSFEGACDRIPHMCPSVAQSKHDMCDYRRSALPVVGNVTLFTDGQNKAMDATYSTVDGHPLMVQLWMMVLSDMHVGNPKSSMDYLVWMWKQAHGPSGWKMYPRDCYQGNITIKGW